MKRSLSQDSINGDWPSLKVFENPEDWYPHSRGMGLEFYCLWSELIPYLHKHFSLDADLHFAIYKLERAPGSTRYEDRIELATLADLPAAAALGHWKSWIVPSHFLPAIANLDSPISNLSGRFNLSGIICLHFPHVVRPPYLGKRDVICAASLGLMNRAIGRDLTQIEHSIPAKQISAFKRDIRKILTWRILKRLNSGPEISAAGTMSDQYAEMIISGAIKCEVEPHERLSQKRK